MQTIPIMSNRKSSQLSPSQKRRLKQHLRRFLTLREAAENLGISRQTLSRIITVGRGSPPKIDRIKSKLSDIFP